MTDDRKFSLSAKGAKQRMTPAERSAANPKSKALAIAAYCYKCQDDGSGTPHIVKARVRDCAAAHCPLWRCRGWQNVTTRNGREASAL